MNRRPQLEVWLWGIKGRMGPPMPRTRDHHKYSWSFGDRAAISGFPPQALFGRTGGEVASAGVSANTRLLWMSVLDLVLRPGTGADASMATLYSIVGVGARQLPGHKKLSKYHKHQTRLLSKICSKIEKRIDKCIEDDVFQTHARCMRCDINRLERTLQGGSLAVYFLFRESQEELARIQCTLTRYETSDWNDADSKKLKELKDRFDQRVNDARKKDNAKLQAKIGDIVKTFQSGKRRMFRRSPEHYLTKLFPRVGSQIVHPRMLPVVFKSMLDKFTRNPPDPLPMLVATLTSYLVTGIDAMTPEQREPVGVPPFELQVIRKTSGSIITILLGSNSPSDIQSMYYPGINEELRLPKLYTATAHNLSQDGFVVAQQAIQARLDSRKYIVWNGVAPSTDIYLVEPPAPEYFILATFLGDNLKADVVKPFMRSRHIKDVLCENEAPWIAQDGWVAYRMHELKCNAPELRPYHHQIFIPKAPQALVKA
ncbi:hypothetical protein C8R47DRAFT_1083141 [Mycena vitilis]|nr:hypothetical protein C8R47DRAFT_1083141 [Mycena vitilis]